MMKRIIALLLLTAATASATLSITARGTGGNNTSANSIACSPTSNMTAGSNVMGVLVMSIDNGASGGVCCGITTTTVADTAGNTWTNRINKVYDPAGASAGVEVAIFTAPLGSGLTTGQSVTINFAGNLTPKTYAFWEISGGGGNTVNYVASGAECDNCTSGNTGTTQSYVTPSITDTDVIIAMMGCEQAPTITGDSDTTNGTWTTQQTTSQGSAGTGISVATQGKIVTATATQSYDTSTGATSVDWNMLYAEFSESGTAIKTVNDLAKASVKTVKDLAIASVKSIMGLQ